MKWITAIRRSLKWKFIVLILILTAYLVLSIGYFSYYESSKTIRNDVGLFSEQILNQANLNLNQFFLDYEYAFLLFGLSYEYQQWLLAGHDDKSERLIMENRIESKFILPFKSQYPDMLSVSLYNYSNGAEKIFRDDRSFPTLDYSVTQESWFTEVKLNKRIQLFVHTPDFYEKVDSTQIVTMVKKYDYGESSGFIKIDILPTRMMNVLSQIDLGKHSKAIISDKHGEELLHAGNAAAPLDSGIRQAVSSGESSSFLHKSTNEMVMFQTMPYTGWKTIVVIPYENVAEGVYRVRDFTVIIAAINFVIAVVAIWMISSSLTSRLKKLKMWIKQTQMGNLGKRITIQGIDEIAELGAAYNRMLDELETSMSNLAESQMLQQQAVLSALQSQIHSHFMYNALESINAMANLVEHKEIMETTVALSDMLRYTSTYRQVQVELREEIKHVNDFIRILNIMYDNRITLILNSSRELEAVWCLKVILQPIIENSIKHGFETTGTPMSIEVHIEEWEEKYVRITVHDNGGGFQEEKLKGLQQQLALSNHHSDYRNMIRVGLLNVHYRLRVFYRDEKSGIQVSNDAIDGGAVVQVIFPMTRNLLEEKEESDAASISR